MKKTLAASMLMISIMFSSTLASNAAAADNLNRLQGNQSSIASAQPDGADNPATK
ncbi:hypothetical protein [Paenibacillus sp. BIHB 4019]|uniref:hypothetical protein n=1 Tax=Paenibacillus sp. BIHB 4019 TaxID=1870819 RepID=UPI0015585598|nr:hypothetical protein [Paenibacillus sp. BIHB 4019]